MALPVSVKCDLAISRLDAVKAKYFIYFTGGTTPDAPLIACASTLNSKILSIKGNAVSGITNQTSGNGSIFTGATACSIDSLLGTLTGFNKWAEGLKAAADGTYIDHINTELLRLINTTETLSNLRTTICNLATYADSKLAALDNLLLKIGSYLTTVSDFLSQLSYTGITLSCERIIDGMSGMSNIFSETNPGINNALTSVTQAKAILGENAKKSELNNLVKEKLVANGSFDTKIAAAKDGMTTFTNSLLS